MTPVFSVFIVMPKSPQKQQFKQLRNNRLLLTGFEPTGARLTGVFLGRSNRLLKIPVLPSLVYEKGEWRGGPSSPFIGTQ
jgi:hypothetical protein